MVLTLALGGESITSNNTAIAAVSMLSLVLGYLFLWGLWHFVFREKREKPGGQTTDSETNPSDTGVQSTEDTAKPIYRRTGSPFKRR